MRQPWRRFARVRAGAAMAHLVVAQRIKLTGADRTARRAPPAKASGLSVALGRTLATETPEHDCQQDSGGWEADHIPNDADVPDVHVGKRYAG